MTEPIILPKNSLEQFRLSISDYNGRQFANLRVYYRDDNGEYQPSKKGLAISPANWPAFRAGIEELERQMREQGLLKGEGAE